VISLIGIPLVLLLVIIQTTVMSRLGISNGAIDLVMISLIAVGIHNKTKHTVYWFLWGGFLLSIISAIRFMFPIIPFFLIGVLVEYSKKRIGRVPIMLMLLLIFISTLIVHIFAFFTIYVTSAPLPPGESFMQVVLPSIALNIFFGVLIYLLVHDWYEVLLPAEEE
jgi:hypothetical protein